jgi:hypothetical protein
MPHQLQGAIKAFFIQSSLYVGMFYVVDRENLHPHSEHLSECTDSLMHLKSRYEDASKETELKK